MPENKIEKSAIQREGKFTWSYVAIWDSDRELYYAHVGKPGITKTILITVWGNSYHQTVQRAQAYAKLLNSLPEEKLKELFVT